MLRRIVAYFKLMYQKMPVIDRYLLKQVILVFIMGVFVFSTIIFASDTFITLIKQISQFGSFIYSDGRFIINGYGFK